MRFAAIALGLLLAAPATAQTSEQTWERLDGAAIAAILVEHPLAYESGAWQRFLPSGRTLYTSGEPSWGYWQVENDRYCSRWPPGAGWDCYDVEHDGRDGIRFIDDGGNVTAGVYSE